MNRLDMISRVRSLTRDLTSTLFREQDIVDFINEGIDRCVQIIPSLDGMTYLTDNGQVPTHLPSAYHSLLAIYSTSRCFGQDERHYQASTYMNEFETKMDELRLAVENGRISIKDASGVVVDSSLPNGFVTDDYYFKNNSTYNDKFDFPEDEDL